MRATFSEIICEKFDGIRLAVIKISVIIFLKIY